MAEIGNAPVNFGEYKRKLRGIAEVGEAAEPLQHGGGGGTFGGMGPEAIIDAKIGAAEARVDTKFAELRLELQRLPGKATIWGAVASIAGIVVGAISLVLAVISFGGDRFDGGMSARTAVEDALHADRFRQAAQDAQLAAQLKAISAQNDELAKRIDTIGAQRSGGPK
jgi:hypothetical protein